MNDLPPGVCPIGGLIKDYLEMLAQRQARQGDTKTDETKPTKTQTETDEQAALHLHAIAKADS